MSIHCDVILRKSATPAQLTTLGTALWRWRQRGSGHAGIYQDLDNQILADLIAGKLPASSQTPRQPDRRSVHLRVQGEAFPDRQAAVDSLRRELRVNGVEDIVVDGAALAGCVG